MACPAEPAPLCLGTYVTVRLPGPDPLQIGCGVIVQTTVTRALLHISRGVQVCLPLTRFTRANVDFGPQPPVEFAGVPWRLVAGWSVTLHPEDF